MYTYVYMSIWVAKLHFALAFGSNSEPRPAYQVKRKYSNPKPHFWVVWARTVTAIERLDGRFWTWIVSIVGWTRAGIAELPVMLTKFINGKPPGTHRAERSILFKYRFFQIAIPAWAYFGPGKEDKNCR